MGHVNKSIKALSSFNFTLIVEILALKIRAYTSIKRIAPGVSQKLHSQYADDIWAGIRHDQDSLDQL